jgi:hypothetical protein
MNIEKYRSSTSIWLLFGFISSLILSVPVSFSSFFDDAYIHARLAENFLTIGHPIFNQGEHFKIGSSTGYIFLVSGLSLLFNTLTAIRFLEIAIIIFTVTGIFYLLGISRIATYKKALIALSLTPYFLLASYGGMETPIVCLLITYAVIAWLHNKHSMVMFLIAVSCWFRFESLLLLLLVCMYYLFNEKTSKTVIFYAFPLPLLFTVELIFFGDIIPNAARVKSIAYGFPIKQSINNAISFSNGHKGIICSLLLVCLFIERSVCILRSKLKLEFSDIFLVFSTGVLFAWSLGRSLLFPWYYCMLVFPFGIYALLSNDSSNTRKEKIISYSKIVILVCFALFGYKSVFSSLGISGHDNSNQRVVRYMEIGTGLNSFCPSCVLVTSEIGGLGYSFKGRVYDAFGLGDPAALKYHPMKVPEERKYYALGAIPPKYIEYRKPDYIVSMPVFSSAFRNSNIASLYNHYDCPFGKETGTIYGDNKVQIFSLAKLPEQLTTSISCVMVKNQE